MAHHKTVVEADNFRAEIHHTEDTWHAKVRLLDDEGQRGKNLNYNAPTAGRLADTLGELASALSQTASAVLEMDVAPPEPVQPEEPAE